MRLRLRVLSILVVIAGWSCGSSNSSDTNSDASTAELPACLCGAEGPECRACTDADQRCEGLTLLECTGAGGCLKKTDCVASGGGACAGETGNAHCTPPPHCDPPPTQCKTHTDCTLTCDAGQPWCTNVSQTCWGITKEGGYCSCQ